MVRARVMPPAPAATPNRRAGLAHIGALLASALVALIGAGLALRLLSARRA